MVVYIRLICSETQLLLTVSRAEYIGGYHSIIDQPLHYGAETFNFISTQELERMNG